MPTTSPYGDISRWDLLWIGHCGSHFPSARDNIPIGRAVIPGDETVPEPQHIKMQFGDDELVDQYAAHSRVVSRARDTTCTVGYGISSYGARRLLYELGLNKMSGTTDVMLRQVCDGLEGRKMRTCLSVQPQLFQHHRPVGLKSNFSNISPHPAELNENAFTRNVRWSTRMNLPKLVDGSMEYIDQFQNGDSPDSSLEWK